MATRYAVANGNWSNLATWDGGATFPQAADTVVANGFTVTIDQDVTVVQIRTLTLGAAASGGGFVLNDTRTLTANVLAGTTVCVTFSANSPATAAIVGTVTSGSSGFTAGVAQTGTGTLTVTGAVTGGAGNGNQYAYGIRVSAAGTLNVVGNCSAATYSAVYVTAVAATVSVTGTCTGGSTAVGQDGAHSSAGAAYTGTGTVTIVGNCVGGTGFSPGLYNTSTGTVSVTGDAIASASSPGIIGTSTGVIFHDGDVTASSAGFSGVAANKLIIHASNELVHTYRENNGGVPGDARSLYTGGVDIGNPAEEDVREGTDFGPSDEYTGTLAVPDPAFVSLGVETDDTVGTLVHLLAADIRSAVGLAAANLDTQLAALAVSILTRLATAGYTAPPTANQNAAALLDLANGIETGVTPRQAFRAMAAMLAGENTGAGEEEETFKAIGDPATTRVTGDVDDDGNRSNITLNL